MQFTLSITLGNAEMYAGIHIADALRDAARRLEQMGSGLAGSGLAGEEGLLKDANGNTVGRWDIGTRQPLTQVEFEDDDFDTAEKIARKLGYKQTAYTSTSALWGLFCIQENPVYAKRGERTDGGCIIKTVELGFLFVQNGEDLNLGNQWCDV
jgi:hypothetical protein